MTHERRTEELNESKVIVKVQYKAELLPPQDDDILEIDVEDLTPEEIAKQVETWGEGFLRFKVEGFSLFKKAKFETIIDGHQIGAVSESFGRSPTYWINAKQLSLEEHEKVCPNYNWHSIFGDRPIVLTRIGRITCGNITDVFLSLPLESTQ